MIFPELYFCVWPFTKMLSISVAVFSVILVGSVICGVKLLLKSCSKNLYVHKSVAVAVILKKWPALQGISDVTTNIDWT